MTIGLTGGIGSGKSTVAAALEAMGYPVFYSDQVAKEIMRSNAQVRESIIQKFGQEAYQNGEPNRQWIAQRIFSHPEEKEWINQCIHPRVRKAFEEFASHYNEAKSSVFNEAAILFETGGNEQFNKTILVVAPQEVRIERVMKRDACAREDVLKRMNNQWTDERKIPLADWVIVNDGEQPVLLQIERMLDEMNSYSTSS
jgi:dephospho-CoA kinase